jgi:hypothetical protein
MRRVPQEEDKAEGWVQNPIYFTFEKKGRFSRKKLPQQWSGAPEKPRETNDLQMLRSRSEARAGAGEFCDSRAMNDSSKSLP